MGLSLLSLCKKWDCKSALSELQICAIGIPYDVPSFIFIVLLIVAQSQETLRSGGLQFGKLLWFELLQNYMKKAVISDCLIII
jgi:hypothetical protein